MKILLEDEMQMVAAKSTVALSVTLHYTLFHLNFVLCEQELTATFGPQSHR